MNSLISAGLIAGLGVFNLVCIKEMRRKQEARKEHEEKYREEMKRIQKKLKAKENQIRHLVIDLNALEKGAK